MIAPREYQSMAVGSIFDYFRRETGNPVIAMPTGTGKSVVIGEFLRQAFQGWPTTRVVMATHVKELVEQNAKRISEIWPNAPVGIHSAGLKRRDINFPIIFGSIQSLKAHVAALGYVDLLLIDECHLLSPNGDTMYQAFIAELMKVNPKLKVIGFTATPWRTKQGYITEGGIFTDMPFNATSIEWFDWFFHYGHLVPPIPKRMQTKLDVEGVKVQNGEYQIGALQDAVDKQEVTYAALRELCEEGADRRSWLIFATGVEHAEHVAEALGQFGVPAAAIHSRLDEGDRDRRLAKFKAGELRCVVNNNVLTTGFDHPPIDLIGMMRPTMSPGLWVQMIGRGMRPSEGKSNCLVLDFARNTARLGPINDPRIPTRHRPGLPGDAPVKICEAKLPSGRTCNHYNHTRARYCENCGAEFTFSPDITRTAGTEELVKSDEMEIDWFPVSMAFYDKHQKDDFATPVMRVRYVCGLKQFSEWVCFEHPKGNFARNRAEQWWMRRFHTNPPDTIDEALTYQSQLPKPDSVKVWHNRKWPEILEVRF